MLLVVLAFSFFFLLLEGSNFPVTSSCPQRVNVNVQMSPWNLPSEGKVTWISPLLAGEHCKETMPLPCLELRLSSTSLLWCLMSHKKKSQPIKIPKVTEKQVIPKLGGQKVFPWLIISKGAVGWVASGGCSPSFLTTPQPSQISRCSASTWINPWTLCTHDLSVVMFSGKCH